jgi:capsular exopolysaccharide synthesis family protein
VRLIESRTVRDAVEKAYDGPLDVGDVQASAPESDANDVIEISLTSPNRAAAADLVNLYADTYTKVRRDQQVDDLLAASEEIQVRLDDLRNQISQVSQPLDDINARIAATQPDSAQRAALEDQRNPIFAQVMPQLAPLLSRQSSLQGQLEQLQVSQDLAQTGGVKVLDPADTPSSPVSPNTARNLVLGGLIGLLGGTLLAFFIDYVDDSVRSKDEVERLTGLPTLGLIPRATDRRGQPLEVVTVEQPSSPAAEAYRALRTSVKFLGVDTPIRTVLVTSAAPSEGKTVTAANLAVTLAQTGERVLLVGADLRRPRVHELFGAPLRPGLTTLLLENADAASAIYAVEDVPTLHVLPQGPPPPNPAELLDGPRAHALFAAFAASYDTVIIDSPPVLPVTDASVLAKLADVTLVVVAYRETSKRGLVRALELLGQVQARTVGTVVNLVPTDRSYGGQEYRYEAYHSRSESRRKKARERADGAAGAGSGNGEGAAPELPTLPPAAPDSLPR